MKEGTGHSCVLLSSFLGASGAFVWQGGSTEELLSTPLCAAAQGKCEQTSSVELDMIIEAVQRSSEFN